MTVSMERFGPVKMPTPPPTTVARNATSPAYANIKTSEEQRKEANGIVARGYGGEGRGRAVASRKNLLNSAPQVRDVSNETGIVDRCYLTWIDIDNRG